MFSNTIFHEILYPKCLALVKFGFTPLSFCGYQSEIFAKAFRSRAPLPNHAPHPSMNYLLVWHTDYQGVLATEVSTV